MIFVLHCVHFNLHDVVLPIKYNLSASHVFPHLSHVGSRTSGASTLPSKSVTVRLALLGDAGFAAGSGSDAVDATADAGSDAVDAGVAAGSGSDASSSDALAVDASDVDITPEA
jgi:hypothetical protein